MAMLREMNGSTAAAVASISREQAGILAHEAVEGQNPGYCIAHVLRIGSHLSTASIRDSLEAAATRHETLRSSFPRRAGRVVRMVAARPILDIAESASDADTPQDRRDAIVSLVDAAVLLGFDVSAPPLWRARVLRFGAMETVLVLVLHHLVADGWSMALLAEEVVDGLSRRAGPLPAPVPYEEYAARCGANAAGPAAWGEEKGAAWPDLGADRTVVATAAGRVERRLAPETAALLREGVRRSRVSPHALLLALWIILLARYSDGSPPPVTVTFARRQTRRDEAIFGPCYASAQVAVPVDDDVSVAAHVAATWRALSAAHRQALDGRGRSGRVSFSVHPGGWSRRAVTGLGSVEHGDWPVRGSVGSADVFAYAEEGGWRLLMSFRRREMGEEDAAGVLERFEALLTWALRDLDAPTGRFPLMAEAPNLAARAAWRFGPPGPPLGPGLVARFLARARTAPDAPAISFAGLTLTWREVSGRASDLAARLQAAGAGPGWRVGLRAPRSPAAVIGQIAIRSVGASFVPLDPTAPDERQAAIVGDAGLTLVVDACDVPLAVPVGRIAVDGQGGLHPLPVDLLATPLAPAEPDEAYILYTSGSTGRPKGVMCSERALLRQIGATGSWAVEAGDLVLSCAPPTFDLSIFEIWNGLLAGRGLVVVGPDVTSVEALADLIRSSRATFVALVPRVFHDLVVRCRGVFDGVRQVLVGGDVNATEDFARCREEYPDTRLTAIYGPTETGITATAWTARTSPRRCPGVPIGTPLAATRVAVVDPRGRPVPPGIAGELVVAGDGVELGYLGDRALTQARFRTDPLDSSRWAYWTGDVVKAEADGLLRFVGRRDRQFKIGAHRIEPAEIEAAGLASGCVEACVALLVATPQGGRELALALVPRAGLAAAEVMDAVRRAMARHLSGPMMPSRLGCVAAIPVTAHGKTDVDALLAAMEAGGQTQPCGGASPLRELVLNTAAGVLGRPDLTPGANFFAAGGHSLSAVDLCCRLAAATGRSVPLRAVFEAQSLSALAALVDRLRGAPAGLPPISRLDPAVGPIPASLSQRRLLVQNVKRSGTGLPVVPLAFALHAPVRLDALRAALAALAVRHPILASAFAVTHDRTVVMRPLEAAPELAVIDVDGIPEAERLGRVKAACRAMLVVRNDVVGGSPVRWVLFTAGAGDAILLALVDHIAHDGRSIAVLRRDLMRDYARTGPPGRERDPPDALTFLDYAAWEAQRVEDGTLDRLARAAASRYGARGPSLWTPGECQAACTGAEVRVTVVTLPCGTGLFKTLARRTGVTTFAAVLACLLPAVAERSGLRRLRVAVQVSTRIDHRLFEAVGPFMNTTYLDVQVEGAVPDVACAIQRELLDAQDHALVPIGRLEEEMRARGQDTAEAQMPDLFFALDQTESEMEEMGVRAGDGCGIAVIDTADGWDPPGFVAGFPLTVLGRLDSSSLSLRIGLHPGVRDAGFGTALTDDLAAREPAVRSLLGEGSHDDVP